LLEAGIRRVVVGSTDPHPRVNGAGVVRLRAQHVEVTENVLRDACEELLAGFAMTIRAQRPLVTLKLASSLDGKIATAKGESQWLTSAESRRATHALRGRHDAVLVGVGTVLADDPALTCRIEGFRALPLVRIVVDSHLRTPLLSQLVRGAAQDPLWILHRNGADRLRIKALESAGAKLIELPHAAAGVDLSAALHALTKHGLTRVLVEGGGTIAAALLREKLADRLAWFHAPCVIGADGWPAAQGFGIGTLAEMPRFSLLAQHRLGSDIFSEYKRA
jgi:diaminohydroxyphosphoribosylaminopyrimidine deaminase/5-amino-6-(5-phosphoribosylamino)uracil reductase